jgi:anion-transporting  ArsA/GET3 family ATPase
VPVLAASRVTVVAGKGGVGKTTVTAVLARSAARAGLRVVVVELDGKPVLAELVGDLPVEVISAPAALEQYLQDHGFGRIARRLSASGVIEVVGTAAPGIDDIVVLGKIKQLERSGDWDVVLVDGPAAGHAVTFLTSAVGLQRTVRGGPVRTQADDVVELLRDPARCQVMLVTLPETTPVNELVETAYALEDKVGVHLGPVVVNAVDRAGSVEAEVPDPERVDLDVETVADRDALRAAAAFRSARLEMQAEELQRLGQELALDQLHVPLVPTAGMTAGDIDALADAIEARADGERA